jgi:putative tryptophan/tyrosine transport system substrate-binding protein
MKCRPFPLTLLTTIVFASLIGACSARVDASPTPQARHVGLMHWGTDHNPPSLATLVAGLGDLGWFDGPASAVMQQLIGDGTLVQGRMKQVQGEHDGLRIELIWRNLESEQVEEQAREFVRERVDLIVAFEDKSIRAAQAATADTGNRIPVVFLHPSDPVRDGLVESLSHPGGNLTGVWGARDPVAKQLEIYRQILPDRRPLRLLSLVDPTDAATTTALLAEAREAASKLGIELREREAADDAGLEAAFQSLGPREVDGAFILSPSLRLNFSRKILALAAAAKLPVQAHRRQWVDPTQPQNEQGALFSVGVDVGPVGAEAASIVDSILKGARPADLPPREVPRVEFVLSLRRAAELGIEVPDDVQAQAALVYR